MRQIRPGDAFVSVHGSNGAKFNCKNTPHEINIDNFKKLPSNNITIEFRRMIGQEKIEFNRWLKRYNIKMPGFSIDERKSLSN